MIPGHSVSGSGTLPGVSEPDDGTTDFRVGGLRDLLEEQQAPPKGGGAGRNRQLAIIGGVAAVLVVVVVAVLLAGGGGDGDGASQEGTTRVPVKLRGDRVAGDVQKNAFVSVCEEDGAPTVENVRVVERKDFEEFGTPRVTLDVAVRSQDVQKIKDTSEAVAKRYVYAQPTCPAGGTPATGAPTTPTEPPTTPPETTPTSAGG